jgi:hypothetical protein
MLIELFKYGVCLSILISLISLTVLILRTFVFGKNPLYAKPQGDIKRGIFYAFGQGMMPWEKESAKRHLLTFSAGIIYHISVLIGIIYLLTVVFTLPIPSVVILPLRIIYVLGICCGFSLLLKRLIIPEMRTLSCPDDFFSNFLVDIFMIFALVHTFSPGIELLFYLISIILFLYIPIGKIRHCFFFFYVRILFGNFYGRRGIFPPAKKLRVD